MHRSYVHLKKKSKWMWLLLPSQCSGVCVCVCVCVRVEKLLTSSLQQWKLLCLFYKPLQLSDDLPWIYSLWFKKCCVRAQRRPSHLSSLNHIQTGPITTYTHTHTLVWYQNSASLHMLSNLQSKIQYFRFIFWKSVPNNWRWWNNSQMKFYFSGVFKSLCVVFSSVESLFVK